MGEEYELHLTDLIDTNTLQKIQDAFSEMTGMAALTTDVSGKPVTQGSNFTEFCMKYTRTTMEGCMRCEQCDRIGAERTWERGKAATYYCHAGLIDFAAPIIANGKLVGCFIGGQVLTVPPNERHIRQIALEIGVNPDEYWEAANKVKIIEKRKIDSAANFLYSFSDVLSNMAYGKHMAYEASSDMEKAARMKSDFLANMSHEIRTPMNAIIGMTEMALREEIPPAARKYVNQIKVSGRALLTIINDILDFSKIESGKMDIVVVEYEPMSLINDIVNIVQTRLSGKDVELVCSIEPDIPNRLLGDNIRIKQILTNLANNAVKFTQVGKVSIRIDYKKISEDEIELRGVIEDTGIGIKKTDMGKLFQSFQQLDSKRNRNIEGTGLGLAISKQLLTLMNGDIHVESEYGEGSTFSFTLPQKVVDAAPSITMSNVENILAVGLFGNMHLKKQMQYDSDKLGVTYRDLQSEDELYEFRTEKELFVFIERELFTVKLEEYIRNHPEITGVLMINFFAAVEYNIPNLLVVRKPLYTLNLAMLFNRESTFDMYSDEEDDFEFIAPDAKVLIVDDNAVNLTVAEGLLEPLQMKLDTAMSGKEAVNKIMVNPYDMVFMDHMMPEMDGVETTHIIRRFQEKYSDVPIIALTANAVSGTREMFLKEGMNDFVAKPIELQALVAMVKKWLPKEKIQRVGTKTEKQEEMVPAELPVVGDLDTQAALGLLGSEKLFWKVLKDYYRMIDRKAARILELKETEDWSGYTIEVHALKSSSKQIGAMQLSERAAALEKAGNEGDIGQIQRDTDEMLAQYRGYMAVLAPFFPEEETNEAEKPRIDEVALYQFFMEMKEAVEDLDMDRMEAVVLQMDAYCYTGWQEELFAQLKGAVEVIDGDSCETIIAEWERRMA